MFTYKLPDIGEGLSEAELLQWQVAVGDSVTEGQEVACVSTDKVNVDLVAPCTGTVAELCWKPGDIVQVGQVFMRIDDGRDGSAQHAPDHAIGSLSDVSGGPTRSERAVSPVNAPPAVRRHAKECGIDIEKVSGSGPDGQV